MLVHLSCPARYAAVVAINRGIDWDDIDDEDSCTNVKAYAVIVYAWIQSKMIGIILMSIGGSRINPRP